LNSITFLFHLSLVLAGCAPGFKAADFLQKKIEETQATTLLKCSSGSHVQNGVCIASADDTGDSSGTGGAGDTEGASHADNGNGNGNGGRTDNTDSSGNSGSGSGSGNNSGNSGSRGNGNAQNVCTPNSKRNCSIDNGSSSQTCNPSGSGWESCGNLTSCDSGYKLQGGRCVELAALVSEFGAKQEIFYSLPVPYREIRADLETLSTGFANKYLNGSVVATSRTGPYNTTCSGNYILKDFSDPYQWPFLGYMATALHSGSLITKGDPEKTGLSDNLRTTFLQIADHMLANANATNFSGLWLNNGKMLGWNNLASPWDAWTNGTCSPAEKPNLYASGWALQVLAEAYLITRQQKYLDGFIAGSIYWHSGYAPATAPSSEITNKMASYGPYAIYSTYTVGGSDYYKNQSADEMLIRYHYYDDDPGRFPVNDSAEMALAMILGGLGSPNSSYTIGDGRGGAVARTFPNIGFWGMFPVLINLNSDNYGYEDIADIRFSSLAYNDHFEFTAYFLARAGALLNNSYFSEGARRTTVNSLSSVSNSSRQSHGVYVCLVRQLDTQILDACRSNYATFKSHFGRANPYGLFAVTAILNRGL
ncbi:MAG: hypothetical protein AB7P49_18605, partial [Bdellovibrionales bacterium]